jgi:hypothetical protein
MSKAHRDELKRLLIQSDAGVEDYLDFQVRCVRKFGPAAGLFVLQLVYWVGKEHDEEGWIYKTQRQMEEETGLSRWHQEKARAILLSQGVLKVALRGLPRTLWYWVDLEALLQIMETPHSTLNQWARKQDNGDATKTSDDRYGSSRDSFTEHTDEVDSMVPTNEYVNTDPASEYGNSVPTSEDGISGRAITESTSETTAESSSEKYSSENSNFQFGEDHASRDLSPYAKLMNIGSPQKSPIDNREFNRIGLLLTTPGSEAYRACQGHREGSLSLEDLASEVCNALTGSCERAELYIEPVQRWVADLAIDEPAPDQPIRAE